MYEVEKKTLKSLVGDEAWELFKHYGVIIAGGAITSLFTGKEVNDIDVYFSSEEQLVRVLAAVFGREEYTHVEIGEFSLVFNGTSQRTLMLKDTETQQDIQFMTFKWFDGSEDIFDTFDYTVCMGAYLCGEDEFVFHPEFMKHNAQRYLKFNPGTAYPLMSLMRVDKYRQKGFTISKTELLRVMVACMGLGLSSWADAKDHIGGMYGYDLNDAFDETQEFSLENLSEQLNSLHERDIKKWIPCDTDKDFIELCKTFVKFPKFKDQQDPCFDDTRYLYKCVNENWQSPIWSQKKITYRAGGVLSSEDHGKIFFHPSSDNPYHKTKYWIEAKLLEGDIQSEPMQKVAVKGKVEIVRQFIYDPFNDDEARYIDDKYIIEEDK